MYIPPFTLKFKEKRKSSLYNLKPVCVYSPKENVVGADNMYIDIFQHNTKLFLNVKNFRLF